MTQRRRLRNLINEANVPAKNQTLANLALDEFGKLELFHNVNLPSVEHLLRECPVKALAPNESLIAAGDPVPEIFFVLSGRLRVQLDPDNDERPLTYLDAGQSVGEIAIIDRQPSSAYVIADQASRVFVLDEVALWALSRASHQFASNLLQMLAQRLRYGNSVMLRIQDLLREYEHDVTIDPLTGLYNRRWLDRMLSRMMHRYGSGRQSLSIIMIDIDHFKRYNDSYGHQSGDTALHTVAQCLINNLRPEDTVARYGGEELMALLPGIDLEAARPVAERLRSAVSTTSVTLANGRQLPPLTISLGIAQMQDRQDVADFISAADEALYRAKDRGRNQVAV